MAIKSATISEYSATTNKSNSFNLRISPAEDEAYSRGISHPVPNRAASLLEQAKENAVKLLRRPWHKRTVTWDDQEWDTLEYHSRAYDTHSLMISCGTVTMDRAASPDRKVLLIWNRNTRAWQLPKGRKNVHEDFAAAALRETAEETGIAVQPLYLRFCTRLTLPERSEEEVALQLRRQSNNLWTDGGMIDNGTVNLLNKDIFCASQYPDPATGAMRHIYWYAARPLKGVTPDLSVLGREDGSTMTAQWFAAAEAVVRLRMSVERKAVALAVHYAEQMTEEEWRYSLEL
ncbi:putative Nudix hydrolase domain-containing protein [Seiridium unicorne]|uniref:Nudix hydrolase domain-containing protein n=1 Tax=Seiridium unicorne TaxID=138068 RepID=A0ABR2UXK8_9PEZI